MIIEYRNADLSDADEIFELECECFSDFWRKETIKLDMANERTLYIAAFHEGKLAGYVTASFVCDESELNRIAVKKEYRKKQIASALMRELIAKLKLGECKKIFLEVRQSNFNALNLYKKFGFKKIGCRKNYYSDPCENAVIMQLEII